jgi:hypothetical protein
MLNISLLSYSSGNNMDVHQLIYLFSGNTCQTDLFNATLMRIEKALYTYSSKMLSAGRAHAGIAFSFC